MIKIIAYGIIAGILSGLFVYLCYAFVAWDLWPDDYIDAAILRFFIALVSFGASLISIVLMLEWISNHK